MRLSRRPDSVSGRHMGGSKMTVTYQVVELDGGHAVVHTRDDLHCNGSGVDMLRIQAVAQPRYAGSDLIELNALFASI